MSRASVLRLAVHSLVASCVAVALVLAGCSANEAQTTTQGAPAVDSVPPSQSEAVPLSQAAAVAPSQPDALAPLPTEPLSAETVPPQRTEIVEPSQTEVIAPSSTEVAAPEPTDAVAPSHTDAVADTRVEPDPLASAREVLAAASPPSPFREGLLSVRGPSGTDWWPVLVADSPEARRRGLMGVNDFTALGGYAAMAFIYDQDTTGNFWMRNTPLALRIIFVTADGRVRSITDMTPCMAPIPDAECERYGPGGPYRIAIEHPIGPDFDIGLAHAELIEVIVE